LLNTEHNEESLGETEQPLDLSMTSGYQEMSSACHPRNTERVNIRGSNSDGNNTNSAQTF